MLWSASLVVALPGAGRAESPLDRLRQRSADARWQTIRPAASGSTTTRGTIEQAGAVVPVPAPAAAQPPSSRAVATIPGARGTTQHGSTRPAPRRASRDEDVLPMQPVIDPIGRADMRGLFDSPARHATSAHRTAQAQAPEPSPELLPIPDDGRRRRTAPAPTYDLSPIQDILPYADYEPDPELAANDPCANQCPRPEGCPPGKDGTSLCPEEVEMPYVANDLRSPSDIVFAWEASNVFSNPLYFDDPQLERYGHTFNPLVQPFVSYGRFGAQLVAMPYKATIDPYCKRMYALGFYRPGDCAPRQIEPIPWNRDAAIVQGAATTGAVFLIP